MKAWAAPIETLAVILAIAASAQLASGPAADPKAAWGDANGGLQMAISAVLPARGPQQVTGFQFAFKNVGWTALTLSGGNLGLTLTDSKGATRSCSMPKVEQDRSASVKSVPALTQRRIEPGNSVVLQIPMCRYADDGSAPIAGHYRAVASYQHGAPQSVLNSGSPPYWFGEVHTGALEIELPGAAPSR